MKRHEKRMAIAFLAERRWFGYPLSTVAEVRPGQMYPTLAKWMGNGWLHDEWLHTDQHGNRRRRYCLTIDGEAALRDAVGVERRP